jgi:hypothetical protein
MSKQERRLYQNIRATQMWQNLAKMRFLKCKLNAALHNQNSAVTGSCKIFTRSHTTLPSPPFPYLLGSSENRHCTSSGLILVQHISRRISSITG